MAPSSTRLMTWLLRQVKRRGHGVEGEEATSENHDSRPPSAKRTHRSVRSKLIRASVGIWTIVTVATLGGVATVQYRETVAATIRTQERVFRNQREKGRLLVYYQALALRGMALDNAISDVRQLVRRTVQEDKDVIYGAYVDAEGTPWLTVSPTTGDAGVESAAQANTIAKLPQYDRPPATTASVYERRVVAFGQRVEEHAADVFDGREYLGTIRYGISLEATEEAVRRTLSQSRKSLAQILVLVALLGATGTLAGVLAIKRMAARITEPLAVLARASEEITKGNRGHRAAVQSGDELEQLALTFNAMAEAIQNTMAELETKTAEALEASRLKGEFLANMSHEIRTPINGILGVVRLVHKLPVEGKLRRYLETIDSSASALLTTINDILDFSKMEAGKYSLRSVPADIQTVVQEVCELLAARAHDKGVELICRIDPSLQSVHNTDPDRFRQVVTNLVGNAIKFTETGEIFVDLRVTERTERSEVVRLSVLDTGIGIAPSDIDKLFDAFSQVDGSVVRRFGGTGLGLAISRRLVEMMGGKIGVRSVLGEGSEFFCTFPLEVIASTTGERGSWADKKFAFIVEANPRWQEVIQEHLRAWGIRVTSFASAHDALACLRSTDSPELDVIVSCADTQGLPFEQFVRAVRALPSCESIPIVALYQLGSGAPLSDIEKELAAQIPKPVRFSELYNAIQESLTGSGTEGPGAAPVGKQPVQTNARILIVDDNEINRFVAQEMLEQMGYAVETAENGAEAVDRVSKEAFLMVLMDCQMPVMDGYSATQEIRVIEKNLGRRTTIVALTAHALSGERDKVLAAGMDDYLAKPVRPASLDKIIRRYAKLQSISEPATPDSQQSSLGPEPILLDGRVRRTRKLIELFLRNMPSQLAAVEAARATAVPTALAAQAHRTKGSCLALGATAMAAVAERLQHLAEKGTLEGTEELSFELSRNYARTERELRRELENL